MSLLANNGDARFVTVYKSEDYPEYEGARALAAIVNAHLVLIADCIDGVARTYRSTSLVNQGTWCVTEDGDFGSLIRTRTGKRWVLG